MFYFYSQNVYFVKSHWCLLSWLQGVYFSRCQTFTKACWPWSTITGGFCSRRFIQPSVKIYDLWVSGRCIGNWALCEWHWKAGRGLRVPCHLRGGQCLIWHPAGYPRDGPLMTRHCRMFPLFLPVSTLLGVDVSFFCSFNFSLFAVHSGYIVSHLRWHTNKPTFTYFSYVPLGIFINLTLVTRG